MNEPQMVNHRATGLEATDAHPLGAAAATAARHSLKLAKLNLYFALLSLPNEQLTVNEVELGYRLALDGQVQEHLEQHMSKPQNSRAEPRAENPLAQVSD